MKKLFSTYYSAGAFNTGLLLFRLTIGALMINHGYDKMVHFNDTVGGFEKMLGSSFLGMSPKVQVILTIFAEFFCSALLIIGLFTRLATIPLIITMCVILFKVNGGDLFGHGETATLYLGGYLLLLFVGPGKASVDGMIGK